jgi:pimeloyl-ACP methyl ester carboxylesterase
MMVTNLSMSMDARVITTSIVAFLTIAIFFIRNKTAKLTQEKDLTWFGPLWADFLHDYDHQWSTFQTNLKKSSSAVPYESKTINSSQAFGRGSTTQLHLIGKRTNPTLLLLPGIRGTSSMWIPNIESLAATYFVICADYPFDLGRSVPGQIDVYTDQNQTKLWKFYAPPKGPQTMVLWLSCILNELEITQLDAVGGFSLGAFLTAMFALHAPDLIRPKAKLFLGAPPAVFSRFRFSHLIPILLFGIRSLITGLPFPRSICMVDTTMEDYKREKEAGTLEASIDIDTILKYFHAKDKIIRMGVKTFPLLPFGVGQFSLDELKLIAGRFDPVYICYQWDCWYHSDVAIRRAAEVNIKTVYEEKSTHRAYFLQPKRFHQLLMEALGV